MAGKEETAEPSTADDIMSPAEMKPVLAKAKRGDPVSCAVGLTKEKDGLILLDKRLSPKKLLAELKKHAAEISLEIQQTSLRFGTAEVDVDEDPKLIKFMVNKEAPGALRAKLLESVRRAGFSKVEISVGA